MARIILAAALALSLSGTGSLADYCDRYPFGSQEWWNCKASQTGGSN